MAVNSRAQNTIDLAYAPKGFKSVFPKPIKSPRAPVNGKDVADFGQLWIDFVTGSAYIYVARNVWSLIAGAGAGLFASLTVTPGPTSLTGNTLLTGGTFTVNSGAGNAIAIGTDVTDKPLSLGSATGVSTFDTLSGTGGTDLDGTGTGNWTFFPSQTTGTFNIGGTAVATGLVTLFGGTGAQTINLANSTGVKTVNIASGAAANVLVLGSVTGAASTTIRGGTLGITLNAPFTALPGPVYIYTGAGAPAGALALHVGDLYINTTAASAVTRMYIATAVGAWTNFTTAT